MIGGLTLVSMMVLGASEAWAESGRRGQGSRLVVTSQLVSALHLTPMQTARIQHLRQDMIRDLADERVELRQLRRDLEQAQLHPIWNSLRILRLNRQISALQDEINERQAEYSAAVFRILTPQQRALYGRMMASGQSNAHNQHQRVANRDGHGSMGGAPSRGGDAHGNPPRGGNAPHPPIVYSR